LDKLNIDVDGLKKLVELAESHHLEELTVEEGDLSITIKGSAGPAAEPVVPEPEPVDENVVDIVAPLVGVFYRAPSPDAEPFVEVGDEIEVGSEVGLIEAMKVFSPIPSEVAGTVVAIPGQNGKLVQAGEVLVRVNVSEEQT
jgi:biotin carboxyl carrier protein